MISRSFMAVSLLSVNKTSQQSAESYEKNQSKKNHVHLHNLFVITYTESEDMHTTKPFKVIGITGTLGAGKGTVVDYLVSEKGFTHHSVRAFLTKEIRRLGRPLNRDSMVEVANSLRVRHGASYIIECLYEEAVMAGKNCVIESIRSPGEVKALRAHKNFTLLAVDAPAVVRYQRILLRGTETDQISYETFLQNEQREMHSDDPHKQNLAECIRLSDHVIQNDSDLQALHAQIDRIAKALDISPV